MSKAYQERLITLVRDTISLLCKNGLEYNQEFCIEGLLGVTLDKGSEVFLIPIKELVADKGVGTTDAQDENLDSSQADVEGTTPRKKKKRRRDVESTTIHDDDSQLDQPTQDERTHDPAYSSTDYDNHDYNNTTTTPKRQRTHENPQLSHEADIANVKAEDIVVIKEELDDDEDITAFKDNSLDSTSFNQTDTGDPNMPFFDQSSMGNFSMEQLPSGSGLPGAMEGEWLAGDMSQGGGEQWQGQKHQCTQCGKSFVTYHCLLRHTKSVHLGIRYQCRLCPRSYVYTGDLARHVKQTHAPSTETDTHFPGPVI